MSLEEMVERLSVEKNQIAAERDQIVSLLIRMVQEFGEDGVVSIGDVESASGKEMSVEYHDGVVTLRLT